MSNGHFKALKTNSQVLNIGDNCLSSVCPKDFARAASRLERLEVFLFCDYIFFGIVYNGQVSSTELSLHVLWFHGKQVKFSNLILHSIVMFNLILIKYFIYTLLLKTVCYQVAETSLTASQASALLKVLTNS